MKTKSITSGAHIPALLIFAIIMTILLSFSPSLVLGSALYSYDEFNRLTFAQYGNDDTITYRYDSIGNREQKSISPANSSFQVNASIGDQELSADQATIAIDLDNLFSGSSAVLSVSSGDPSLITASISGNTLTLSITSGVARGRYGRVVIEIKGEAPNGKKIIVRTEVVVKPSPPQANRAPVLDVTQSHGLSRIDEDIDPYDNYGNRVSEIVGNSSITDADVSGAAPKAIAVVGIDNSNGIWEFSIDNWAWLPFDTLSLSNAILLDENDKIRFVPDADWNGTSSFTFRAWDKTIGSAGETSDASLNGGQTAFSSSIGVASVIVTPVNDPPVAKGDHYNTMQGQPLTIDILANDSDPDSTTLTVVGMLTANGGSLTPTASGSYLYSPNSGFTGTSRFTYTVRDEFYMYSDRANVEIIVGPEQRLMIEDVAQKFSKNGDSAYSGPAVADTILSYLKPDYLSSELGTDERQEIFMMMADVDADAGIPLSGLKEILNNYLHPSSPYNYGTSADYSDLWSAEDAGNQNRVNQFIMHWLDYEVKGASAGKLHGPAAVATSSDPHKASGGADSDYKHWMTIIGYSSDTDPHVTPRDIPAATQLNGFWISDPDSEGLGSYKYIQANEWNQRYFRPVADSLEMAGKYGAVVEPPVTENSAQVAGKTPESNLGLMEKLNTDNVDHIYPDFWSWDDAARNNEIKKSLLESRDYIKMIRSPLFCVDDIISFSALVGKINDASNPFSAYIKEQFSSGGKRLLDDFSVSSASEEQKDILIRELNRLLLGAELYNQGENLLSCESSGGKDLVRQNRRFLEDAYPNEIEKMRFYHTALDPEHIGRIIKVESDGGDYALIMFEHNKNGKLITTGIAMLSLSDASLRIGFPNPKADFFDPLERWKAIFKVLVETGKEPINAWPALFQGEPLDYGYKVIIPEKEGSLLQFNVYRVEKDKQVFLMDQSPSIELLSSDQAFVYDDYWCELDEEQCHNKRLGVENGFYKRFRAKITDDNEAPDVQWPDSVKMLKQEIVGGGYVYEFIVPSNENLAPGSSFAGPGFEPCGNNDGYCDFFSDPDVITATDGNYRNSRENGGISYFILR